MSLAKTVSMTSAMSTSVVATLGAVQTTAMAINNTATAAAHATGWLADEIAAAAEDRAHRRVVTREIKRYTFVAEAGVELSEALKAMEATRSQLSDDVKAQFDAIINAK